MSGPIVRKYGFPNFDQIFGRKPLEHGVEEESQLPAEGTGLPPDLAKGNTPTDPTDPSSAGKIAPSTEFGSTAQ
jgi:hypothetical protein